MSLISINLAIEILGTSGGAAGATAGARAAKRRRQPDGDGASQGRGRASGITEGVVRGGITGLVASLLSILDWGGRHTGRGLVAGARHGAHGAKLAAPHVAKASRWAWARGRGRITQAREARQIRAANAHPDGGGVPVSVREHLRNGVLVRSHTRGLGAPKAGGMGVGGWFASGMRGSGGGGSASSSGSTGGSPGSGGSSGGGGSAGGGGGA